MTEFPGCPRKGPCQATSAQGEEAVLNPGLLQVSGSCLKQGIKSWEQTKAVVCLSLTWDFYGSVRAEGAAVLMRISTVPKQFMPDTSILWGSYR